MKITFSHSGDFKKTEKFLLSVQKLNIGEVARAQAEIGVKALAAATPKESGLAASSWSVEVQSGSKSVIIRWLNKDIENGFPVAIMLQYGYGTGTGGYVSGRDYINPAIRPVFDKIADEVWKAVKAA